MKTLLIGAVAYDAKVVPIWEGMREHFKEAGVDMDFALFSNYERQALSLLQGHIDIAWNTPLAHVQVQRSSEGRTRSLGMRDTDRDFRSKVIAKDSVKSLKDLEGRRLAVGSRDSVQARILPLHWLKEQGVDLSRVEIVAFDSDIGKHGDTGKSEYEVLECLEKGAADAGIVGDLVWTQELAAGRVAGRGIQVLATTEPFDHCMFDARPGLETERTEAFQRALFDMDWDNPKHRRILEMEGLRKWLPAREEGYVKLISALNEQNAWAK